MILRDLRSDDDMQAITDMLHRAYAPLAARGLRYMATHQDADVTRRRLEKGKAIMADIAGRIVGTITVYGQDLASPTPAYREPGTYHFGQFGIEPEFKGKGIGRALHGAALDYARSVGGLFMALDTAAPATDLVAMYERWGYVTVERVSWKSTNYESVIMRCPLSAGPGAA
jgi:GNAT superfamily N-acetyltransferase